MAEMDEQDPRPSESPVDPHAEKLARYGAPLPPPAFPLQQPSPFQQVPPARRRVPRLLATGTAIAVVAAATGAGFLLGRLDTHTQS